MAWLTKNFLFKVSILFVFCIQASATRPSYKTHQIVINGKTLNVEIADDSLKTSHGLMNIDKLPKGIDGMLFVFPKKEKLSFWMKNTRIPLSIAYIDDSKKIISLQDMEPESAMVLDYRLKRYESPKAVRYALELEKGRFQKLGVELGDKFEKLYP